LLQAPRGLVVYGIPQDTTRRVAELDVSRPSWTPDGRIAYLRDPGQCRLALYVTDPATKTEEIVAARGLCDANFPHAWSPDGSRLVFSSCELAEPASSGRHVCSLVLADRGGGGQKDLLENVAVSDVAWAPDGSEVALTSGMRLRVVDPKTRRVTEVVDKRIGDFAWTPDGRWLMYTIEDDPRSAGLWRVTPDGARREKLLSRSGYTDLAVSRDGKYAATVARAGSPQPGLDVIELQDGILVHRFPGLVSSPDWRPVRAGSG
jgi:Tol biopolymer transport system component